MTAAGAGAGAAASDAASTAAVVMTAMVSIMTDDDRRGRQNGVASSGRFGVECDVNRSPRSILSGHGAYLLP